MRAGFISRASPAYKNHVRDFGHPSEFGYKDILRNWKIAAVFRIECAKPVLTARQTAGPTAKR